MTKMTEAELETFLWSLSIHDLKRYVKDRKDLKGRSQHPAFVRQELKIGEKVLQSRIRGQQREAL